VPQTPVLSENDRRRELQLRRAYEQVARAQRREELAQLSTPQFRAADEAFGVLETFEARRTSNTPRDVAAAFYAFGRKARVPAGTELMLPPQESQRMAMLQEDVISSLPFLRTTQLCNVLLACAYQQNRERALLEPLCALTLEKAEQLNLRDVSTTVYALGRLRHREDDGDEPLLRAMLGRVARDAEQLHAIELSLVASGLAALRLAPRDVLRPLSAAALARIDTFGAVELSGVLASLTLLGHLDKPLLRAAAARLPELLADMNPRSLCEVAAALAAADQRAAVWVPSALELLGDEATAKAHLFSRQQAASFLAAYAQLRWDQPPLTAAMAGRLAALSRSLALRETALGLEALARLPTATAAAATAAASTAAASTATASTASSGSVSDDDGRSGRGHDSSRHVGGSGHDGAATLSRLLDAAHRLGLPPPSRSDDAARRDVAALCGALRHLRAPPPAALLAWLDLHHEEARQTQQTQQAQQTQQMQQMQQARATTQRSPTRRMPQDDEGEGADDDAPSQEALATFRRVTSARLSEARRYWRELAAAAGAEESERR